MKDDRDIKYLLMSIILRHGSLFNLKNRRVKTGPLVNVPNQEFNVLAHI